VVTRRHFIASSLTAFAPLGSRPRHSFSLFSLLKPTGLNVYAYAAARLHCGFNVIEGEQPFRISAGSDPVTVTGPNDSAVSFILEVPGVIRRCYHGLLTVSSLGGLLEPVVLMDREIAVGSIVGAELPWRSTAAAALSAQAVAARSYLCALRRPRHSGAEFCDTTHCQFLRSPALSDSVLGRAVELTRGLVIQADSAVIPAHYSAACGGSTEDGELDNYRYSSVVCETCRDRRIPRRGHGLGLCQTGAMALAKLGWRWQDIIAKYYPNTVTRSA